MKIERIKFIADSASDIPDRELKEYAIDMPGVPIAVDGREYIERESFGIREFYPVLAASHEIPVTSRIPADDFFSCYRNAYGEGYTDVICVTINASGSGTNDSAQAGKIRFYREISGAADKMRIHIIDSGTYSAAYGHPVVEAAKMARRGKNTEQVITYLERYFDGLEIYLGCYTLDYARKSGRITAAAAFMGDVLGVRPIVLMKDGTTKIKERVRGERNLVIRMADICAESGIDLDGAMVIGGSDMERAKELQAIIKKEYGRELPLYTAGASIIINAGPDIVALVAHRKRNK